MKITSMPLRSTPYNLESSLMWIEVETRDENNIDPKLTTFMFVVTNEHYIITVTIERNHIILTPPKGLEEDLLSFSDFPSFLYDPIIVSLPKNPTKTLTIGKGSKYLKVILTDRTQVNAVHFEDNTEIIFDNQSGVKDPYLKLTMGYNVDVLLDPAPEFFFVPYTTQFIPVCESAIDDIKCGGHDPFGYNGVFEQFNFAHNF